MTDSTDRPAPPAFTPVPSASTRRDGWTPQRQRDFIAALGEHGCVSAAARAVGMTPQSANRLRRRATETNTSTDTNADTDSFATAWDQARETGRMRALDEALRVARDGQRVPVTYAGRVIGHRLRIDNRLLFAACYGEPMSRYAR